MRHPFLIYFFKNIPFANRDCQFGDVEGFLSVGDSKKEVPC